MDISVFGGKEEVCDFTIREHDVNFAVWFWIKSHRWLELFWALVMNFWWGKSQKTIHFPLSR